MADSMKGEGKVNQGIRKLVGKPSKQMKYRKAAEHLEKRSQPENWKDSEIDRIVKSAKRGRNIGAIGGGLISGGLMARRQSRKKDERK